MQFRDFVKPVDNVETRWKKRLKWGMGKGVHKTFFPKETVQTDATKYLGQIDIKTSRGGILGNICSK